jgi:hypothetical protein
MSDNTHHRYRGEDLDRYRAALYAQWLASRDGVTILDHHTHPDGITIEYDKRNRVRSVTFCGGGIDVRVRLP